MSVTAENPRLNGVDTTTLFATIDAVRETDQIGQFQFRATNSWVSGTHSRSRITGFYGAMQEMEHAHPTEVVSDHPAVLVGQDNGPTPIEYLLHGIAACLTSGIANIASARGVELSKVSSTVEGDINLLGILGLSDGSVRNGYEQIKVTIHLEGDADDETLRGLVEQSRKRSAVYDALTNPTPRAHIARAEDDRDECARLLRVAEKGFEAAGQPGDAARCAATLADLEVGTP